MHFDHYRNSDEHEDCPDNEPKPINHPNTAKSVPLSSIRPGPPFHTTTGWTGIKSDTGHCYSFKDGSVAWFDPDTPCWEIDWFGIFPARATGSVHKEEQQDSRG